MGPKHVSMLVATALLLAWSGSAAAEQYRPQEYLSLDLPKAVLSPKRLGPPAEFAPVAVEARSDAAQMREEPSVDYRARAARVKQAESDGAQQRAAPQSTSDADRKTVRTTRVKPEPVAKPERVAKRQAPARAKLARRPTNLLDAQAMDTRIQKWPCTSGGICDWKR